jgi:hypothetical protein
MVRTFVGLVCIFVLVLSCKKQTNSQEIVLDPAPADSTTQILETMVDQEEFVPQSTDEQTANNLRNFLTNDYLKDELQFLKPDDRKFQFYKIDLNDDGNEEIFVRFLTPYFCGTGGCTFLLLDKYGEVITKFSVTRAPIFAETTKVNGWSLLLVKDAGVFKELKFNEGTYPSNPSVLPKAPYDAPSGHAQVMFHDDLYKSKTFDF